MIRAPGNVRSVAAVIARGRRGAATFGAVAAALADVRGILYSTHEHHEHAHDFVIVIPLARPASVAEHVRAARWCSRRLARDAGTKNVLIEGRAGTFCYLPSWQPGEPWHVRRLNGAFLDPDRNAF